MKTPIITIKGRQPNERYNVCLKDFFGAHRKLQPRSLQTSLRILLRERPTFNSRPLEAFLSRLRKESAKRTAYFPCAMGDDPEKFFFNLAYQDARIKIELEALVRDSVTKKHFQDVVLCFLHLLASALSASIHSGDFLWQKMNDNDFDALVFSLLEGCDPLRTLKLLSAGCRDNQFALDGLPSSRSVISWSLKRLISFQVFAGTVWWSQCGGSYNKSFPQKRRFEIDHRQNFLDEVSEEGSNLIFLADDNGELVWDLLLARRLLEANSTLQITFVTNAIPVANNSNALTLNYCLNHPTLSSLRHHQRFRMLTEENPRSSLDLQLASETLMEAIAAADIALIKGVGLFETAQKFPKRAFYAFVVHSRDSEIITGLEKSAGVFVGIDPYNVSYSFKRWTLLDFIRTHLTNGARG